MKAEDLNRLANELASVRQQLVDAEQRVSQLKHQARELESQMGVLGSKAPRVDDKTKADVLRLRGEGMSFRKIGKVLGISGATACLLAHDKYSTPAT